EQELANLVDKFYYNKVNEISNTKRIKNDKEQYEGIDIMGEYNASTIFIDEKGYLSIPNLGPTFALEVSFLNQDKKRVEGWLFDSNKKTTHYLLCWNKRNKYIKHKDVKEHDFYYITAMLIERTTLHQYLKDKLSITQSSVKEDIDDILKNNRKGSGPKINNNSSAKYYYSSHLDEKPINIVISKKELADISLLYKVVKRSGVSNANY